MTNRFINNSSVIKGTKYGQRRNSYTVRNTVFRLKTAIFSNKKAGYFGQIEWKPGKKIRYLLS